MAVTIEDVGVCKKKLKFEIPREDIQAKIDSTLDEMVKTAQLPGFRPGHAPRRLVQRKLQDEIGDQVKMELISDAYKKAVEEQGLNILREEEFDPEKVELPEEGPLVFELEVEVKPEIALPDLADITIEVPRAEVSEADVEQALDNIRSARGRFVEQPTGTAAAERDMLTADVHVAVGDAVLMDQHGATLAVFPQAVASIRLETLVDEVSGKAAGDTVSFTATVPEGHEREELRGQEAQVTLAIKAVRRIELPPLDDELAKSVGFQTMDEVRQRVRERLEGDLAESKETARRNAMAQWLLEKVPLEVPEGVAEANASRVFNNQVVDLQRRGIPLQQIQERADELMEACRRRAQQDLKLSFILEALAKAQNIETSEDEVQARVALIAQNYSRPVERMYEDLQKRGYLEAIREQIRDDKVYQFLLGKARVTEVEPTPPPPPPAEKPAAEPAARTGRKGKAKTAAAADEPDAGKKKPDRKAPARKKPAAKADAAKPGKAGGEGDKLAAKPKSRKSAAGAKAKPARKPAARNAGPTDRKPRER